MALLSILSSGFTWPAPTAAPSVATTPSAAPHPGTWVITQSGDSCSVALMREHHDAVVYASGLCYDAATALACRLAAMSGAVVAIR